MDGVQNMNNLYMIIDSNFLCYRAVNAIREMKLSHNDLRTEIIFSFILQIHKLVKILDCNKIIFTWDSIINFRKDLFPGYKHKEFENEETQEEKEKRQLFYLQFSILRSEVLPMMGFKNIYHQTGMEADDIMAVITKDYPGKRFVIVSRDNDLFQLLTPNVWMYDPVVKKTITKGSFIDKWGIVPSRWGEVKCMAGCKGDKVPNVPSVAEKTAIKYLKKRLKVTTKAFAKIKESADLIKRNEKLVVLPFEGTKSIEIKEEQLFLIDFMKTFEKYGFESQLKGYELKQWQDSFGLF